eukprot:403347494
MNYSPRQLQTQNIEFPNNSNNETQQNSDMIFAQKFQQQLVENSNPSKLQMFQQQQDKEQNQLEGSSDNNVLKSMYKKSNLLDKEDEERNISPIIRRLQNKCWQRLSQDILKESHSKPDELSEDGNPGNQKMLIQQVLECYHKQKNDEVLLLEDFALGRYLKLRSRFHQESPNDGKMRMKRKDTRKHYSVMEPFGFKHRNALRKTSFAKRSIQQKISKMMESAMLQSRSISPDSQKTIDGGGNTTFRKSMKNNNHRPLQLELNRTQLINSGEGTNSRQSNFITKKSKNSFENSQKQSILNSVRQSFKAVRFRNKQEGATQVYLNIPQSQIQETNNLNSSKQLKNVSKILENDRNNYEFTQLAQQMQEYHNQRNNQGRNGQDTLLSNRELTRESIKSQRPKIENPHQHEFSLNHLSPLQDLSKHEDNQTSPIYINQTEVGSNYFTSSDDENERHRFKRVNYMKLNKQFIKNLQNVKREVMNSTIWYQKQAFFYKIQKIIQAKFLALKYQKIQKFQVQYQLT